MENTAFKHIKKQCKPNKNNTVHAPKIWIKPVCSVYTSRFSCHTFTVYNCFVICFVHVTNDHKILSLEHQRTQIWHFRKRDFNLTHVSDFEPVC